MKFGDICVIFRRFFRTQFYSKLKSISRFVISEQNCVVWTRVTSACQYCRLETDDASQKLVLIPNTKVKNVVRDKIERIESQFNFGAKRSFYLLPHFSRDGIDMPAAAKNEKKG
jgi:hypothetical protein